MSSAEALVLALGPVPQGVLEHVEIGVVADGVGEQGRDPGARIVALGSTIARLPDPFYP